MTLVLALHCWDLWVLVLVVVLCLLLGMSELEHVWVNPQMTHSQRRQINQCLVQLAIRQSLSMCRRLFEDAMRPVSLGAEGAIASTIALE